MHVEEAEEEVKQMIEEVDLKLRSIEMSNMKEETESQEGIVEKKDHRQQEVVKEIEERHWKIGIEIIEEEVEVEVEVVNKKKEEQQCMEQVLEKGKDHRLTNLLGNGNIEMERDLSSIMTR